MRTDNCQVATSLLRAGKRGSAAFGVHQHVIAVVQPLQTGGHIRLTQPDPGLIQPRTAVHVKVVGTPGGGVGIEVNVECVQ